MLEQRLKECGVPFSPDLPGKLLKYHELLLEWNAKMDLTAVTEEADMIDRHYVDSLMALTIPELIPQGASLIDVGTGAGFPGLPLLAGKGGFARDADGCAAEAPELSASGAGCAGCAKCDARSCPRGGRRAHEGTPRMLRRGGCAGCLAAAVLAEYLLPYVKVGGKAVCWKGPAVQDELGAGKKAAFLLGGKLAEPIPVAIPGRNGSICSCRLPSRQKPHDSIREKPARRASHRSVKPTRRDRRIYPMTKRPSAGAKSCRNDSACFAKGLCFILFLYSVNAVF